MKACPICNAKYFDDMEKCDKCDIQLMDDQIAKDIHYHGAKSLIKKYPVEAQIVLDWKKNNDEKYKPQSVTIKAKSVPQRQDQTPVENNVPKCPTCGSTNVNKISGAKKAAGFITVGVFSSNFGKTMECKNCGYKW